MTTKKQFWKIASLSYVSILSLCIMAVSYHTFLLDQRYAGLIFVARDIQIGKIGQTPKTRARDMIEDVLPVASGIVVQKVCRSDILKAGLTIYLHHLDAQDAGNGYADWEKAASDTLHYLQHGLTCLPSDGNLWLRLAMLMRAVAEDTNRVSTFVMRSRRFAPAEIQIIAGRLRLYNRLGPQTLQAADWAVNGDLAIMLAQNPKLLQDILPKPSAAMRSRILRQIQKAGFDCKTTWEICEVIHPAQTRPARKGPI